MRHLIKDNPAAKITKLILKMSLLYLKMREFVTNESLYWNSENITLKYWYTKLKIVK